MASNLDAESSPAFGLQCHPGVVCDETIACSPVPLAASTAAREIVRANR